MKPRFWLLPLVACALAASLFAETSPAPFDAAPFGSVLQEGQGIVWEDPREIHSVVVDFSSPVPQGSGLRLEYWGSRWPGQHLSKDREPGGGDVGWMELGNWFKGGWRTADAEVSSSGKSVRFSFRPINAREFPDLKDFASTARFTLKIRIAADQALPRVERIQAFTDSTLVDRTVRVAWEHRPSAELQVGVFNGQSLSVAQTGSRSTLLKLRAIRNSDPNTFDRTLVTLREGARVFTFKLDDLDSGALYLPEFGAAVLPESDARDFATVAREVRRAGVRTLYDRVAGMPEQTWRSAWEGMPQKKSRICFVLGTDGSRQKFKLDADGELSIRWNDQFVKGLPARDSARIALEKGPIHLRFGSLGQPVERHIEEEAIPTCTTAWERDGVRIVQTAFATVLDGLSPDAPPPAPDACAVAMVRFELTNTSADTRPVSLPITFRGGESYSTLRVDGRGLIWNGHQVRGQVQADTAPVASSNQLMWSATLPPHGSRSLLVKMPYLPLLEESEASFLAGLDFERERQATAGYWRRVLNRSAGILTPEPVLSQFYRAVPGHLLINAELEPGSRRRFPRVGSFDYGNYGNESCMMILDLDRRGYHQEAADCLDAWLKYQGTVGLPGDFDSKDGVLYGSAGYESGGYNQHHGWILWTLAEHFRFCRDTDWLQRSAPGIVSGADWILRQTARTKGRKDLGEGLLPAGSLEDIGDWWTWLSTSCYTWRGLDGAAWALEQIHHPEAARIRAGAETYHRNLVDHFRAASARSPVVRLRDGTAVPHIPSYVQRRGRSFGWICETLEGAIHLIITGAIDPNSKEAQWILKDYEDNLFLSNQYGYVLDEFDRHWFGRGGMSMQACLLLDVEAYLYRDDVKQALRSMFNGIAVSHFPDVHMNTEHALPDMGDWKGDHYKTSDEANACGWLRYLFVREQGDVLLVGQAVPREWLKAGQTCGIENTATHFGKTSVIYRGGADSITAELKGPTRNPPGEIRLRFRTPGEAPLRKVTVNGKAWKRIDRDWVILPGGIGDVSVIASY